MEKNLKESFPRDTLAQAQMVFNGWKKYKAQMNVPNITMADFKAKIQVALEGAEQVEKIRKERSDAVEARNATLIQIWDLVKRIRNSAKATFGDDSEEIKKFKLK